MFAGALIALHVIFARFISIPVGQILRISISGVPLILSGLWLGPVTGGICGLIGDLIGCAINGYAPNPFITVATVLVGVIPGLFRGFMVGDKPGVKRLLRFLLVIAVTRFISSQLLTTFGLSVMYGMPFTATFVSLHDCGDCSGCIFKRTDLYESAHFRILFVANTQIHRR